MDNKNIYKGKHWSSDFDQLPKEGFVWYLRYWHKAGEDKWPLSVFEVDCVVNKFITESPKIAFWAPIEDLKNPPRFDRFAIEGLLWINENGTVKKSLGDTDELTFRGKIVHQGIIKEVCETWVRLAKKAFTPITEEEFRAIQKPKLKSWRDAEYEVSDLDLSSFDDWHTLVPLPKGLTHVEIGFHYSGSCPSLIVPETLKIACALQVVDKYPKEKIDQETLQLAKL